MSESGGYTNNGHVVGDTVQIRRPDGSIAAGTIIDDYADLVLPVSQLGRDWAQSARWAIALETGVLVFVDDDAFTDGPGEATAPDATDSSHGGDAAADPAL